VQVAQNSHRGGRHGLEAFPSEKHFANWLGLCPTNETSAARWLKRRTPKVRNRAKVAFRQAATSLFKSQSYLGAQFRRCASDWERPGPPRYGSQARLPVLPALTKGQQYVDRGPQYYEARYRQQARFGRFQKKLTNSACKLFSQKTNRLSHHTVVSESARATIR